MNDLEQARTRFEEGLAFFAAGNFPRAEQAFIEADRLAPGRISVLGNLSATLLRQNRIAEAKVRALEVLDLDSGNIEGRMNLGACLIKEERYSDALEHFDRILALHPEHAAALSNRALVLGGLGRHEEALADFDMTISLQPDHAEAWCNRGVTLSVLGRHEEALASNDKSLAINPGNADGWYNRGNMLAEMKRHDEALASYAQATRINPEHAEAHYNEALHRLSLKDFPTGWHKYEWRWKSPSFVSPGFDTDIPVWDGGNVKGSLLVWSEQGIGDEIIYCGMLEQACRYADRVKVALDPRLIPLARRSFPDIEFFPRNTTLAPDIADRQIAMGSLGMHLRKTLGDFPKDRNAYLKSDAGKTADLRGRLVADGHLLCGVSWKSKREKSGAAKSIRLQDLLPVFSLDKLVCADLQYGDTVAERLSLKSSSNIDLHHIDEIDLFNDIDGLASLIDACDFVVTTSNVTAHLAGALGKRTFLLAPYAKGKIWYWHEGEVRSLWYPSVRLYWQAADGHWDSALENITADLANLGLVPA